VETIEIGGPNGKIVGLKPYYIISINWFHILYCSMWYVYTLQCCYSKLEFFRIKYLVWCDVCDALQFNARSESIDEKASFRRLLPKNRCLVAVDGYVLHYFSYFHSSFVFLDICSWIYMHENACMHCWSFYCNTYLC
jgi:hypothetical protein